MSVVLSAEQLCVTFGAHRALHSVSMELRAGEIHAFLGPNGAGKTTTLRVLLDLLRPDSGKVSVFGAPLDRESGEWRSRIGFVRAENASFSDLRGEEFLDLMGALQGRDSARRGEVLDALRVMPRTLATRLGECSSGMRQALCITAAMQHDPELLLLDEPTNALDPLVRIGFQQLVLAARARHCAVLLSSHVLDEVNRVADRVTLIHQGQIVLTEPMAALRERMPRTARVRLRDGREEIHALAASDATALRALATLDPLSVLIEDAGLDELFRQLTELQGSARARTLP